MVVQDINVDTIVLAFPHPSFYGFGFVRVHAHENHHCDETADRRESEKLINCIPLSLWML